MIKRYKRKSYEIEAIQYTGENIVEIAEFVKNNTGGTPEFQACGDKGLPLSEKQEAQPIAYGVGG